MIEVVIILRNEDDARNLILSVLDGVYGRVEHVSFERVDEEEEE